MLEEPYGSLVRGTGILNVIPVRDELRRKTADGRLLQVGLWLRLYFYKGEELL